MALSVGVLVIGSLYWDRTSEREEWRNSHLEFRNQYAVHAPIRYGRKSQGRGNTYTMVFSRLCLGRSHGLGVAKAVSLKYPLETLEQLIKEAECLWAAERNKIQSNGRFSSNWGCVALLVNPASSVPQNLLDGWKQRVARKPGYGRLGHTKSEEQVVTAEGFLNIPWPKSVEETIPLSFDMLLATATDPTLTGASKTYPRIRDIAHAWKRDNADNKRYFWCNIKNGIRTYQDNAIMDIIGREDWAYCCYTTNLIQQNRREQDAEFKD